MSTACFRVLVVDDEGPNRVVAGFLLRMLECEVDEAENGVEAVRYASENEYDLIFMDCMMPVMDGFTAAREIRRLEAGGRCRIVAYTALDSPEDKKRCLESGMDSHLSKPVRLADFKRELQLCRCPTESA